MVASSQPLRKNKCFLSAGPGAERFPSQMLSVSVSLSLSLVADSCAAGLAVPP